MSFYEQNIQALLGVEPLLATRLLGVTTNKEFEVFVDEKDPLNINIAHTKSSEVLYGGIPIEETQQQLEHFGTNYSRYPYLYFFGMGNGVFYKALLQNELHTRIVVIEPEIEILYMALHFNDFSKFIEEKRFVLFLSSDINFYNATRIFGDRDSVVFSKTYQFHPLLSFYETHYMQEIFRINGVFIQAIEHSVSSLGNDSIDALVGLQHQVANLKRMVHTPTTVSLSENVKNTDVAVIVSTGPSLKKQLALLKEIQEHVSIFCIDASLPILEQYGIKPDLVFSLERIALTAEFYEKTSKEFQEDIVFVITSIAHPKVFQSIKGEQLQITMRPFCYTHYLEMPEYGYLGIGMSAANMAYELIYHARFSTCILIGQDLSYGKDGMTHSDGHIFGDTERGKSRLKRYSAPAYGGDGVVESNKMWLLFKNFFETDIAQANQKGILTINATEGGVRIEGAQELPFGDAIDRYVDKQTQKKRISLEKPSQDEVQRLLLKGDEKVSHLISYATKVLKQVKKTFMRVADECSIIESTKEDERYEKLNFQNLADTMAQIDTIKEYFDDQEFANIFSDATQAMIIHQEMELAKLQVRNSATPDEKRQKMIDWVLSHRYWLFSLAAMIEATIDAAKLGLEMQLDFEDIELVRVVIDAKEIATIELDKNDAMMQNIYDIKQLCAAYKPGKKYRAKFSRVKFYYSDKEDSFRTEVHMPNPQDKGFDSFFFANSLDATFDVASIENIEPRETISFLATEKNLDDFDFISLVLLLKKQHFGVPFVAFCFSSMQKQRVEQLFGEDVECIFPKTMAEVVENSSVYLFSKLTKDTLHKTDSKVKAKLLQDAKKVFVIDIEDEIEGDEYLSKISLARADKERDFSSSVASKILQGHEKFNEYRFMNSLIFVDEEEIKDLYTPNAIGFLATEENLADKEFMGYIKELMVRFPDVEFKGFCFDEVHKSMANTNFKKITTVACNSLVDICKATEVFISNYKTTGKNISLYLKLVYGCKNIYTIAFDINRVSKNINEYDYLSHVVVDNYKAFGFNESELEEMNYNVVKLGMYNIYKTLGLEMPQALTIDSFTFYHFNILEHIWNNQILKQTIHNWHIMGRKFREEMIDSKH